MIDLAIRIPIKYIFFYLFNSQQFELSCFGAVLYRVKHRVQACVVVLWWWLMRKVRWDVGAFKCWGGSCLLKGLDSGGRLEECLAENIYIYKCQFKINLKQSFG